MKVYFDKLDDSILLLPLIGYIFDDKKLAIMWLRWGLVIEF